jgi:hypothetical protein
MGAGFKDEMRTKPSVHIGELLPGGGTAVFNAWNLSNGGMSEPRKKTFQ